MVLVLVLILATIAYAAPAVFPPKEISDRFQGYYQEQWDTLRTRIYALPEARFLGDTEIEYRYFLHVSPLSEQAIEDVFFGYEGEHESFRGFFSKDGVIREGPGGRPGHPDWWRQAAAWYENPFLPAGRATGPIRFYSSTLPGIVPFFYRGHADGWVENPPGSGYYGGPYAPPDELLEPEEEFDSFTMAIGLANMVVHDSTVGPSVLPSDLDIEGHLLRVESLVTQAQDLDWIGPDAAGRLNARVRAARRKVMLPGSGGTHNAAAWAKMIQFRDDLRDAHQAWREHWKLEERVWNNDPSKLGIPFIPSYDDAPIPPGAADDRAWALLEPNARFLIDRLQPPRSEGEGRGPVVR